MSKVIEDINMAFDGLNDGMTVLAGGFGLCGIPEHAIEAIRMKGTKYLS